MQQRAAGAFKDFSPLCHKKNKQLEINFLCITGRDPDQSPGPGVQGPGLRLFDVKSVSHVCLLNVPNLWFGAPVGTPTPHLEPFWKV